jgi:hypothetical protein
MNFTTFSHFKSFLKQTLKYDFADKPLEDLTPYG